MEMRAMTPTKAITQAARRQNRNQGYADGLNGTERRRRDDPDYLDGYRRGLERRDRELSSDG